MSVRSKNPKNQTGGSSQSAPSNVSLGKHPSCRKKLTLTLSEVHNPAVTAGLGLTIGVWEATGGAVVVDGGADADVDLGTESAEEVVLIVEGRAGVADGGLGFDIGQSFGRKDGWGIQGRVDGCNQHEISAISTVTSTVFSFDLDQILCQSILYVD